MGKRYFYDDFDIDDDVRDFEDEDFDDDDDYDDDDDCDDDFDDEDEDGGYVPTRDMIAKLLREDEVCARGNKDYVEEAASIIEKWYREECLTGAIPFDDEENFLDNGYWDIHELVDGRSALTDEEGARECHIVWMALIGYDPNEEEDEEEDEEE